MRRISKLLFSCVALSSIAGAVQAQNIGDFLGAGVADGNKLATAYFQPYGEMLGVTLNSGWYTSAKVHRIGGFDLTAEVTYAIAPSSTKSYDVNSLGLSSFNVAAGSSSIAPTLVGSSSNRPTLTPKVANGNSYADFQLPNGAGYGGFALPMIQAGVGLPFHTEIMGRFVPKIDMKDYGTVSLWGLGVKHDLKDYIPFVAHVPVWNLSVMGAYTHFSSSANATYGTSTGSFDIGSDAYTARVLTGVTLPIICFYTGVGYGNTSSNFDLKGTFAGVSGAGAKTSVTNPLSLNYVASGFDFNIGTRLRLGVIGIHVDYTVGKYQTITAGIGVNFR